MVWHIKIDWLVIRHSLTGTKLKVLSETLLLNLDAEQIFMYSNSWVVDKYIVSIDWFEKPKSCIVHSELCHNVVYTQLNPVPSGALTIIICMPHLI